VLICGIIANSVGPGPIVSGMRYYLRPIPLFLLPAVYEFNESQLRAQLRLLFAICVIQAPIAMWQRHTLMATGHTSGADLVFGTLMFSGVMSIFLICALSLLSAAMLRGQLGKLWFALIFLLLVIPMSINETKVTVFLLPAALLITFIVGAPPHKRVRTALSAVAILIVGGSIFVPVFDYYQSKSPIPYKISDFLTKKGEMSSYLDQDARLGSNREAGRVDALTIPFQQLARDPVSLTFGLGLGNASRSNLGANFIGAYFGVFGRYTIETSMAAFLLESGVLGVLFILLLQWMVFRDALFVAKHDQGLVGTLALGFIACVVIMTAANFYITMHVFESASYMFWYFAGLVAARRELLTLRAAKAPATAREQAPADATLRRGKVAPR
jgi:hypothetical protein